MKRISLFATGLVLGLTACSGASRAPAPIPEKLVYGCDRLLRSFNAKVESGRHVPIQVTWQQGEVVETVSEERLAVKILAGEAGQETWVLGRGGSGKSRLADSVQSKICGKALTVRVDCELDLAPHFATATAKLPAIAAVLLEAVGTPPDDDPARQLQEALGPDWILIIDGGDELTPRDQIRLRRDMEWLARSGVARPHLVRFERPGFNLGRDGLKPAATARVAELACEQADGVLARRFKDPAELAAAKKWLAQTSLDRKRAGIEQCRYVHMATWRDAEMIADLAEDAARGMEPFGAHPTRAELWSTWVGHRVAPVVANTESGMSWVDRLVLASATEATDPDMQITVERCVAAARPASGSPEAACGALLSSPLVHQSFTEGYWALKNRTIVDLALARWLVAKNDDCDMLSAAVSNYASHELMAMVVSLPHGRRCLGSLVGAVCSRGIAAEELLSFIDESVPREPEFGDRLRGAMSQATSRCEHDVFEALLPK
ncbi:MAG: hypothetical protein HY902_08150 [Deltaproteobacteria bacterium]|nr:hypothetical protein [Deltaproteobacteria bacterium]